MLELGNEPNAWPYLQRGLAITPERYAQDLLALTSARDDELPNALIGYQILKDFELSIDQRSRRVRFVPAKSEEAQKR